MPDARRPRLHAEYMADDRGMEVHCGGRVETPSAPDDSETTAVTLTVALGLCVSVDEAGKNEAGKDRAGKDGTGRLHRRRGRSPVSKQANAISTFPAHFYFHLLAPSQVWTRMRHDGWKVGSKGLANVDSISAVPSCKKGTRELLKEDPGTDYFTSTR